MEDSLSENRDDVMQTTKRRGCLKNGTKKPVRISLAKK